MSEVSKILFVVEGSKTERGLINRLSEVFGFSAELYTVNGNIYMLYQAVKNDPYAETVKVLADMANSESDKSVLSNVFTDVFLVFDCYAQHTMNKSEADTMSAHEIACRNMSLLCEMSTRFDESTDPLRGKLLVNYPMVESFRDCDDFFDALYASAEVHVDDLKGYKSRVGRKQLVRYHVNDFSKQNFQDLMLMNLCKLNKVFTDCFSAMQYGDFLRLNNQLEIAKAEFSFVKSRLVLSVLNTLLFFPLEYFGDTNGFYSDVVAREQNREICQS